MDYFYLVNPAHSYFSLLTPKKKATLEQAAYVMTLFTDVPCSGNSRLL